MMTDCNQRECNIERDVALAECLEHSTEVANRLQAMAEGPATWPRVGTLLSVKADLMELFEKLPETK